MVNNFNVLAVFWSRQVVAVFVRGVMLVLIATIFAGVVCAQTRDHLTDPESELVRFHQELDKRIDVFITAVNRRFAIINHTPQPSTKKTMKEEPEWGDLPQGTHAQLLFDIAAILDEAITNIDDVSRRDEKNPLISRSLRKLTAAANGYVTELNTLRSQTQDDDELAAIDRTLEIIAQIIEVGEKMPAPTPDEKKKKKP
jgi:large-conductance mechanosensitive channel